MGYEPGDEVSGFRLANANGEGMLSLEEIMGNNGTVVVFECNHCPYVIGNISRIEKAAKKAEQLGMGFVGINSNDANNYPEDSFENMQKRAVKGMSYPYLYDESQEIASVWGALRTPEFYLINSNGIVVYRGRLDDSPRNPIDATTSELDDAMEYLAVGNPPAINRTESIGCSIKWK
jgi:peroxiredoxin